MLRVPLCPPVLVTTTLTTPAACAGVVALMDVLLVTETFVAAVAPNVTVAPVEKLVPVMVTFVPPAIGPALGDTPVTVGAGLEAPPENVAICMTQGPVDVRGAAAL